MTSEKRRAAINGASNAVGYVVTVIVVFFVSPILVHGLGDERYGIWQLVNSILAYLAMADLGIGAALLRFVARFDGLDDKDGMNRVFSCSMVIFASIGLVILLVIMILALAWTRPFGVEPDVAWEARALFAFLGINLAMGFPMGLYRSVLSGLGHYPTINIIKTTALVVRNLLFVVVIWRGGGMVEIGFSITLCAAVRHSVFAYVAHRRVPGLRFSRSYLDQQSFRDIFSYSVGVFTAMTAGRLAEASTPIIIGFFMGPIYVTYFFVARHVPEKGGQGIRSIISVLTSSFSRLDAQNKQNEIRQLFFKVAKHLNYLALPVFLGVILLGHHFLTLWMGEKYADEGSAVMSLLVAPLPLSILMTLTMRYLHGLGQVRVVAICSVAKAIITLILSVLLVVPFGIWGVALGRAVSSIAISMVIVFYGCTFLKTNPSSLICSVLKLQVIPFLVLLGTWWGILQIWALSNWLNFFSTFSAGLFVYTMTVMATDSDLRELTKRVRRRFRFSNHRKTEGTAP